MRHACYMASPSATNDITIWDLFDRTYNMNDSRSLTTFQMGQRIVQALENQSLISTNYQPADDPKKATSLFTTLIAGFSQGMHPDFREKEQPVDYGRWLSAAQKLQSHVPSYEMDQLREVLQASASATACPAPTFTQSERSLTSLVLLQQSVPFDKRRETPAMPRLARIVSIAD